jgi:hypothetical protein
LPTLSRRNTSPPNITSGPESHRDITKGRYK